MTRVLKGSNLPKGDIMRKLAILAASSLLIAFNAFASEAASIDAKSLAKTIMNMHKVSSAEKGSFAIVYGGQDISRGNSLGQRATVNEPILIG